MSKSMNSVQAVRTTKSLRKPKKLLPSAKANKAKAKASVNRKPKRGPRELAKKVVTRLRLRLDDCLTEAFARYEGGQRYAKNAALGKVTAYCTSLDRRRRSAKQLTGPDFAAGLAALKKEGFIEVEDGVVYPAFGFFCWSSYLFDNELLAEDVPCESTQFDEAVERFIARLKV